MIVCIQALQIGMFQLGSMRLSMTGSMVKWESRVAKVRQNKKNKKVSLDK